MVIYMHVYDFTMHMLFYSVFNNVTGGSDGLDGPV